MPSPTAKYLIITGLVLVLIGIIWYFFGDKLGWVGRLPGDIRIERPGLKVYVPITTMILASLLLSLLMYLIRRF
ncbi:MAG: DUF2905 domain-containing protein [Chitinophagaceae bacterium]|jgi:hypothetical protein